MTGVVLVPPLGLNPGTGREIRLLTTNDGVVVMNGCTNTTK